MIKSYFAGCQGSSTAFLLDKFLNIPLEYKVLDELCGVLLINFHLDQWRGRSPRCPSHKFLPRSKAKEVTAMLIKYRAQLQTKKILVHA